MPQYPLPSRLVALLSSLAVLGVLLVSPPAFGDGDHKEKAEIENRLDHRIKILRFDGDDGSCGVAHGDELIVQAGRTQSIHCHPRGKDRCKVTVSEYTGDAWVVLTTGQCQAVKDTCWVDDNGLHCD